MTSSDPGGEPLDVVAGGRRVTITHPDRVVWPVTGTTKRELVAYLVAAAPALLPHLAGRATMLWRFPEGVDGKGWFQAQCRSRPPWVRTADVIGRRGDLLRYCLIEEPATLAWLANLGTIELHPHGWTVDAPETPTAVLFDLDPGPPAGLVDAARVALRIADRLRDDGLDPVVKTSGSLGLHVAAAVETCATFAAAKQYARDIADALAAEAPDTVIARSDRAARAGRVYIDWVENDHNRQLVAPWSPRATPVPRVSLPLAWDEVAAIATGRPRLPDVGFDAALARIPDAAALWLPPPRAGPPPTLAARDHALRVASLSSVHAQPDGRPVLPPPRPVDAWGRVRRTMASGSARRPEARMVERGTTTSEALQEWREAEQAAAVARRGKTAAETASAAAALAAEAALATAEAAKAALEAATRAEASAAATAEAAKTLALHAVNDLADANAEAQIADATELAAKERYRAAAAEAEDRQRTRNPSLS